MGYPMSWTRVIARNNLAGDYSPVTTDGCGLSILRGDLRRLERDQRDELHLEMYARKAGITVEQAKIVLDALFSGTYWSDGLGEAQFDRYRAFVEKLGHNP